MRVSQRRRRRGRSLGTAHTPRPAGLEASRPGPVGLLRACTAVGLVWLAGCAATAGADMAPVPVTRGPATRPPGRTYPTTLRFSEPYARAWDGAVAVLASRGFPLITVSRDSGVLTTGWRVTQPNHRAPYGERTFIGRKVERLTVLVRPVRGGTEVSVTSQTALASPQWSAAGPAPAGQVLDLDSDTVTEYGLLHDLARVLGQPVVQVPDPAYGVGLPSSGIFETSPVRHGGQEVRP